jgi:superfamily I DNA and RNA helicase
VGHKNRTESGKPVYLNLKTKEIRKTNKNSKLPVIFFSKIE